MPTSQLLTCEEIEPAQLNNFLQRVYHPLKSAFLIEHGAWWHGSDANRLVILLDGRVAGYCGVMPTKIWVNGRVYPALWWVDLVIDPEFRGRGLQTIFDQRVREMSELLLGFPNELAAKIHRKHGWGVREEIQVMLLPLQPMQVKSVNNAPDRSRRQILRAGALALSPLAALWQAWLSLQNPPRAWKMKQFNAAVLADVFQHSMRDTQTTTWRDVSYLEWRYGCAPRPEEYSVYLAGTSGAPTHYLIARHTKQQDGFRCTRVLDLVGDFGAEEILHDLLILALQDAIKHGSSQFTLAAGQKELQKTARQLGLFFTAPLRFCWWSSSSDLMSALAGENYWTLGDSDNDSPN